VAVYEGDVNVHQWIEDMAERIPDPPERYPWMPRQSIDQSPPPAHRIARIRSGAEGQWEARIPRLPFEHTDWLGRKPEPGRLSIVAADASLERTAVSRFSLSDVAPDIFEADLELCPIEEELIGYVLLDGQDGLPMAGATFNINSFGPFVSDALGVLRVPRFTGAITLTLASQSLRIAGAQFCGNYSMPSLPESDIERETNGVDYDHFFVNGWGAIKNREGNHADPDPPALCRGERTLNFHYFDSTQGILYITLEPVSN
jgi:hypothetical protein